MTQIIEGKLTGKNKKIAVVVSRFNSLITEKLLEGALDCLKRHEVEEKNISVAWCPGSFEIPFVAKKMAFSKSYDAVICLGAVIKGATAHFDYVAGQAAKGIGELSLNSEIPVIFGVITTDSIEQALERAGTKAGNKGWDAALTAIEMINLSNQL